MNKLPDVVDVKFCLSCKCMTWHTAEGRCEWSDGHNKDGRSRGPLPQLLSSIATGSATTATVISQPALADGSD